MPSWSLFVPARGWGLFCKCLKRNGGDDETRTRDLCRDSSEYISVFNDLEEHGRHPKSSQVRLGQSYCVPRCVPRRASCMVTFFLAAIFRIWVRFHRPLQLPCFPLIT